jgi:hypothetical protein
MTTLLIRKEKKKLEEERTVRLASQQHGTLVSATSATMVGVE